MAFPIQETKHDKIGDGWHITTDVTVSANGRVDGLVRLENYNNLRGFKAGSVVLLGDASGNLVWGSHTHKTGVNATGFSRKSTAKEDWVEEVPSNIIGLVVSASIVNKKTPDDDLWGRRISEAIGHIKKVADLVKELS